MPRQSSSPPPPPPPANFAFTAAGFDFPHASTSPPAAPRDASSTIARSAHVSRRQRAQPRANAESDGVRPQRQHSTARRPPRPPRRSMLIERPRDTSTADAASESPRPPSATGSRPRATPSERYLRRHNARLREQPSADMDSTPDPWDPLGDAPMPNVFALAHARDPRPRSPPGELVDQRRQTKRRKLAHDASPAAQYHAFRYGYKGQVVPGRLKMEVVSCDGGEYSSSGLYKIHNVLRNDKSVYCSESSHCNLLLKHISEAPFALDKVVIRAPDRGFTAPVQEGLIFVAMSPDDLLSGTAGYEIHYGSESPHVSPAPSSSLDQQMSFREALDDAYVWDHSRHGRQAAMEERFERMRRRLELEPLAPPEQQHTEERPNADNEDDAFAENCDYPTDESYAAAAGVSAPTPPPFTITTESGEESDENEELPSAAIMADRLRRESRWRPDSDDEDEDLLYRFPPPRRSYVLEQDNYGERSWRSGRGYLDPIRANPLRAPSRIELNNTPADPDNMIAPHARFFIAKHKNKITIKFNPAV
ncbi:hypothetical protein BDV95DRAFT_579581 [Massariosphaeria phaeospora]|uniref:Uncharacterized protein n=1 Tax=Massariosphaeria phaeospora TaxID=100035 RepID=A0A7C8I511_9PLEO|nr:hypothetical protein BDV95DRAFT_579581 [Massariosphaeria phaeospora]